MCGLGLLVVDVVWWWLLSLVWFSYYVYGLGVFSCVNFYRLRVFGFLVVCGLWMLCLVCLWFVASSGLGVVCCDLGTCRLVGCC